MGCQNSTLLIIAWPFQCSALIQKPTKSHLIRTQSTHHSGNYKGFRNQKPESETKKGFLDPVPLCMYVCVCGLSTPIRNSWTSPECLRNHLNSGTIYPETESDSTGKGHSPTRCQVSTLDAKHKARLLPGLLIYPLQILGSSNPLLGFD